MPARTSEMRGPKSREGLSRKGEQTRARLIDAAKKIFERDGFLKARITDIADAAAMSHGSFYHYFQSKEEIFREVAEAQEISLLHGDKSHLTRDPYERIRLGVRAYLEAYRDAAPIMRVIEEVSRYDDEVRRVRRQRQDEFAEGLRTAIVRLQVAGQADIEIDSWYAALALGGMVSKFAEMWLIEGQPCDMDASVTQLTRLWANAIGLKPPAS